MSENFSCNLTFLTKSRVFGQYIAWVRREHVQRDGDLPHPEEYTAVNCAATLPTQMTILYIDSQGGGCILMLVGLSSTPFATLHRTYALPAPQHVLQNRRIVET